MNNDYEADVSVQDCWKVLEERADSFLIDVRTSAEWNFVGLPQTPDAARPVILAEWQTYPSMQVDHAFAERVAEMVRIRGGTEASPLFFLCRSGARSMGSAAALTGAGFEHCYNVADGFEGPPDAEGHRGTIAGWKAAGLPWGQK